MENWKESVENFLPAVLARKNDKKKHKITEKNIITLPFHIVQVVALTDRKIQFFVAVDSDTLKSFKLTDRILFYY